MIEVEGLTKRYGGQEALSDVSFTVAPGTIMGYLGPNGAGKTTTVKILVGMLRPSAGRARVAGFDVASSPVEVKRRIGYVPESGALYEALTVREFLTFVARLHALDLRPALERAEAFVRSFGILDRFDARIASLSKGMKQKTLIASALLHDPEVLVLDEPLSGLDANAALLLKDLVRNLAGRGKTILYCSHVLEVVERICERVTILDRGRVVAAGATRELLASLRGSTLEEVFHRVTGDQDHAEMARALSATLSAAAPVEPAATPIVRAVVPPPGTRADP